MNRNLILEIYLMTLFLSFNSCEGIGERKYTPKEFLNHTVIHKENYNKDSIEIIRQLKNSLKKHDDFFYSKDYFEGTQIIIDSIIYSPDFNKLAVFIMTKNPTSRQLLPDKKHDWYYDGTCYLGLRQNDTICLSKIGPDFSNSPYKKELSFMMRETYFTTYAIFKDTSGAYRYKYNIDDIRFWDCPIWKEIEDKKVRKREFEEEKKNHPENIYEPKH